jgi:arsenate reductase
MASRSVRIYHNPRCTKSREALALLEAHGVKPEVVEYLKTPLDAKQVKQLVKLLGVEPHALLRTKEAPYAELGLSRDSSLDEIARAVAGAPILLERPIVVAGDKAVIGRPTENVLSLLKK